jgi:hypothetical protein
MTRPPVRAPAQEALTSAIHDAINFAGMTATDIVAASMWLDDIESAAAEVFGLMLDYKLQHNPIVLDVIESPDLRRRRKGGAS